MKKENSLDHSKEPIKEGQQKCELMPQEQLHNSPQHLEIPGRPRANQQPTSGWRAAEACSNKGGSGEVELAKGNGAENRLQWQASKGRREALKGFLGVGGAGEITSQAGSSLMSPWPSIPVGSSSRIEEVGQVRLFPSPGSPLKCAPRRAREEKLYLT